MTQMPLPYPQSDLERFGYTQCAQCGDLIHQDEAEVKTFHTGGPDEEQEHFCPPRQDSTQLSCHEKWHIGRLNTLGM